MTEQDELANARWRTSSFSAGSGDCVQVAWLPSGGAVRDSKNTAGGALCVGPEGMDRLMASAQSGALRAR